MSKKIFFTKMQGAGNDYVYINIFEEKISDPGSLARKISDRHFGVGSDGLVLVGPSKVADLRMRMFNSDGSEAEMCGNASRCVGKFAFENALVNKPIFTLETGAGIKTIELHFEHEKISSVTVDMGEPVFQPEQVPFVYPGVTELPVIAMPIKIADKQYNVTPVGMGNPHAVVFADNVDGLDLRAIGPFFENHPSFPKKTNTEFARVISPQTIRMRVWERGAEETLACGTGACAALVASVINGYIQNEADVEVLGGKLHIRWDRRDNHIYMTGPAVTVFTGEYLLQEC